MADEPLALDFIDIWQSQPAQQISVSLEEIQERAKRSDLKTRRGTWIFAAAVVLHTLGHILRSSAAQGEFVGWIGLVEFATLVVLLAYWPYQYARKVRWPLSVVPRLGFIPGLDFYRRQLELRRDFAGERLGGPAFVVVAAVFVLHAVRYPSIMLPIAVPCLLFAVWLYVRWKRELPMLQQELDDLKAFMRETRI